MPAPRTMNTAVPYRRPSHRSSTGHYVSKTNEWKKGEWFFILEISLVWFNRAGWYYIVELAFTKLQPTLQTFHDISVDKTTLWQGPDLPLCSFAAEDCAKGMLEKHGIRDVVFEPFTLAKRH